MEHNDIIKEEHEGDLDANKVDGEVGDKQREDLYNLNGERADVPND